MKFKTAFMCDSCGTLKAIGVLPIKREPIEISRKSWPFYYYDWNTVELCEQCYYGLKTIWDKKLEETNAAAKR